ncbi:hypothetical protein [Streptosporangium sp. NPDC002524]|uniref:hypothetical protein n=1 Tax=Streptosporangium sp. NPDC002524 TaxID=3154537 RepID=UPI0033243F44
MVVMVSILKRVLGWVLLVVAIFMVFAGLAAVPLISDVWEHRRVCGENYESIEAALTPSDLLEAAPAGAVPDEERDRDCTDTDDHHATISRFYHFSRQNGSREDIDSFYRDLALRNGWKLSPGEGPTGEVRCVAKESEGAEINFEVSFGSEPEDTSSEDTSYIVRASTWPC